MIHRSCLTLVLAAFVLLPAAALAEHHEAAERAVVVAEKVNLKGKVISIDAATRSLVVEGEQGGQIEIHAPANSPNFDQIKVGDPVAATYVEAIAISIAPVADAQPGVTERVDVSTAPKGATPGGVITEQIELRAVVKAVDAETREVTLDVPAGGQRTIKAGPLVQIEKVKVGEQVRLSVTRALAITIDKQ